MIKWNKFFCALCAVFLLLNVLSCSYEGHEGSGSAESDENNNNRTQATKSLDIKDYEQARSIFWKYLYSGQGETLYCKQGFDAKNYDGRKGLNIEHVFPMGWVKNALNCGTRQQCRASSRVFNQIEADLHNLYPSRTDVNSARSSYRFGEVKGESRRFGRDCDFEVSERYRVAEPMHEVRGDIARAMLYMEERYKKYGLEIFSKQRAMLKQWHYSDPPTKGEVERNTAIAKLQGNINPFIGSPNLVK